MPDSKKISKSQAIRNHMAANPGDGPSAAAASLCKAGVQVTAAFVSTIKTMDKSRKATNAARSLKGIDSDIKDVCLAKVFAGKVGGVDKAMNALVALKRLRGEA